MRWDWSTPAGQQQERLHRLAVLHDLCPECASPPGEPSRQQWLAEQAHPRPNDHRNLRPGSWSTPEGEHACFVHGAFRVHDREAFQAWAAATFTVTGDVFAYVVTVDGEPWTRALFWFDDDQRLLLETASSWRYFHLENVFEHLWPPVFRGSRIAGPLDDRLDAPYRPIYPCPPAAASVFTRLHRIDDRAVPPAPQTVRPPSVSVHPTDPLSNVTLRGARESANGGS